MRKWLSEVVSKSPDELKCRLGLIKIQGKAFKGNQENKSTCDRRKENCQQNEE